MGMLADVSGARKVGDRTMKRLARLLEDYVDTSMNMNTHCASIRRRRPSEVDPSAGSLPDHYHTTSWPPAHLADGFSCTAQGCGIAYLFRRCEPVPDRRLWHGLISRGLFGH